MAGTRRTDDSARTVAERRWGLAPVAWLLASGAILAWTFAGPPLWSMSAAMPARHGPLVVAWGQLLLLAIGLPIWLRARWGGLGWIALLTIVSSGAAVALADQPWRQAWRPAAALAVAAAGFATLWAIAPRGRGGRALAWIAALLATVGSAAATYLHADFSTAAGGGSHLSPPHWFLTTFLHR